MNRLCDFTFLCHVLVCIVFYIVCEIDVSAADCANKVVEDIKELFHVDQFVSHTDVEFDVLSQEVIRAYIETGEPM